MSADSVQADGPMPAELAKHTSSLIRWNSSAISIATKHLDYIGMIQACYFSAFVLRILSCHAVSALSRRTSILTLDIIRFAPAEFAARSAASNA